MTNCKNCGAPLDGTGKCPYCGTVYEKLKKIADGFDDYWHGFDCTTLGDTLRGYVPLPPMEYATLKMSDGEEVNVIIENVDIETAHVNDFSRKADGRLSRAKAVRTCRITCVAEF